MALFYMRDRRSLWVIRDACLEGLQEADTTFWSRYVAAATLGAEVTVDVPASSGTLVVMDPVRSTADSGGKLMAGDAASEHDPEHGELKITARDTRKAMSIDATFGACSENYLQMYACGCRALH